MSSIIRNYSKSSYSHISVSLNDSLCPMYAMGRVYARIPLIAGLVEENVSRGLYALKPNTICRVYSLSVTERQYDLLNKNMKITWSNRRDYKYDVGGLVRFTINRPRPIVNNKYVCSNFVADLLERSNIHIFDKPSYMIQPKDFLDNDRLELIYEGLLSECNTFNGEIKIV